MLADATLGRLNVEHFVASARKKIWWMIPNWGSDARHLAPETQYVLGKVAGSDEYVVVSGMLDAGKFRSTMRTSERVREPLGRDAGPLDACVRVESGSERTVASQWRQVLYVSVGTDPYALVDEAIVRAANLSGGARARADKVLPPNLDLFGWCTWDAFYSEVDADGIERGLLSFAKAGIRPGVVIIDDGWQQVAPAEEFRRPDNVMLSQFSDLPVSSGKGQKNESEKATAKLIKEATNMVPVAASQLVSTTVEALLGEKESPQTPSLLETITASLLGSGTRAIMWVYQTFVDEAPPFSLPYQLWKRLSTGLGKGAMLGFYADFGDHSKRLCSVTENSKFESLPSQDAAKTEVEVLRDGNGAEIGESLVTMYNSQDGDDGPDLVGGGLKALVTRMKERHGVQKVMIWHALTGYWCGVEPDAPDIQKLGTRVEVVSDSPVPSSPCAVHQFGFPCAD